MDQSGHDIPVLKKLFRSDCYLFEVKPVLTLAYLLLIISMISLDVIAGMQLFSSGYYSMAILSWCFTFCQLRLSSVYFLATHPPCEIQMPEIFQPSWCFFLWLPLGLPLATMMRAPVQTTKAIFVDFLAFLQAPFLVFVLLIDHINLWRRHSLLAREIKSEAALSLIKLSIAIFQVFPQVILRGLLFVIEDAFTIDMFIASNSISGIAFLVILCSIPGEFASWYPQLNDSGAFGLKFLPF
mmetsp:Transcript_4709/g.6470  ORF Transcript_4709/g.6470 Transcript_4709/m.6470 type:complete len:240 (+) Transcript_4709:77-796(+)